MRFAAIADVHGNRPALEAVLADIAALDITEVANLGDHVSGPLEAARTADLLMAQDVPNDCGRSGPQAGRAGRRRRLRSPRLPGTRSKTPRLARQPATHPPLSGRGVSVPRLPAGRRMLLVGPGGRGRHRSPQPDRGDRSRSARARRAWTRRVPDPVRPHPHPPRCPASGRPIGRWTNGGQPGQRRPAGLRGRNACSPHCTDPARRTPATRSSSPPRTAGAPRSATSPTTTARWPTWPAKTAGPLGPARSKPAGPADASRRDTDVVPQSLTAYIEQRRGYDYAKHGESDNPYLDFITDDIVDSFAVLGEPQDHIAKLKTLQSAGITQFNIYLDNGDEERDYRRLWQCDYSCGDPDDTRLFSGRSMDTIRTITIGNQVENTLASSTTLI